MRSVAAVVLAGAVLVVLAALPTAAAADDLIVRYASGVSADQRERLRGLAGVRAVEALPLDGLEVVSAGVTGAALDAVIAQLRALPGVRYVERDAPIRRHAAPDDPLFGAQYAHGLLGTPLAWDVTTGSPGVTVAVVDSGADLAHPDLRPNLWTNRGERPGNRRDDDRNGYVDDVHGYDFSEHDGTPQDADGHGSHVSGIVAAGGNDGFGVSGTAWRAGLLPLRVLDEEGEGTVSDAVKAYGYALRAGARVVNVSWGGPQFTRAERDMIAGAPDVLFVASAGNEGDDVDRTPLYPCAHDLPNVVCVAATDQQDALASFSNRGARSVDLAAPGVAIASTVPGPGWSLEDGTSMAAPFVSGAAALMLSRAPAASALDLRGALLATVDPLPTLAGATATGGRLNVARAVQAIGATAAGAAGTAPPQRSRAPRDRTRPRVQILSATPRRGLRRVLRRGLRVRVRCSEACALRVELTARHGGRRLVLASGRASRARRGTTTVRLRFSARRRRSLARGRYLRATLRARATDRAGNVGRAARRVRWRR